MLERESILTEEIQKKHTRKNEMSVNDSQNEDKERQDMRLESGKEKNLMVERVRIYSDECAEFLEKDCLNKFANKKEKEEECKEILSRFDEALSGLKGITDITTSEKLLMIDSKDKISRFVVSVNSPNSNMILYYEGKIIEYFSDPLTDGKFSLSREELKRFLQLDKEGFQNEEDPIDKIIILNKIRCFNLCSQLPIGWKKIHYEQFNPAFELRKISFISDEESRYLTKEQRMDIKKERMQEYKINLMKQKEGIVYVISKLELVINDNPATSLKKLLDIVYKDAEKYHFNNHILASFELALNEYAANNQSVETFTKRYPNPSDLFTACFGREPKGKIEIIKGAMSLYFRCFDLEDYALIYSANYSKDKEIDRDTLKKADASGGVAIYNCLIPELYGCVIAENAIQPNLNEITYIHENQHLINRLFQDTQRLCVSIDDIKNSPKELKLNLFERALKSEREENFEARAKDEILAYIKDGRAPNNILKILLKRKDEEGLYDYYDQWKEKNYAKILKLFGDILEAEEIERIMDKIFCEEYEKMLTEGLAAVSVVLKRFTREKVINILASERLSSWKKVLLRLTECEYFSEKK
ncbi:MAG: hypothetical protein V1770_05955 [bacterium]